MVPLQGTAADETTSSSSSNPIGITSNDDNKDDNRTLLSSWAEHTDLDFHRLSPERARQIRTALLDWYHEHRRPLPWRGDPPPWRGSTAANNAITLAANETKKSSNNNKKKSNGNQTKLDGFFRKPKRKDKEAQKDESPEEALSSSDDVDTATAKAFPVTAYGIWVSEIMLQQTRVEAVIPFWLKWMQRFPTVQALAEADAETVNAHWAGLGFYRRARFLHQASQQIVADDSNPHHELPGTVAELQALPGIGRYTASAIASIAFGVHVPVVDGNVCRVLSRLTGLANHIQAPALKDRTAWELAQALVEKNDNDENDFHPGDVNQALMELGATYCAPSGTGVDPNDPLVEFYASTQVGAQAWEWMQTKKQSSKDRIADHAVHAGCPACATGNVAQVWETLVERLADSSNDDTNDTPATREDPVTRARRIGHSVFPLPPPKTSKREEVWAVAVLQSTGNDRDNETAWLMVQRPKTGLLAGQWEFPAACLWNSAEQKETAAKKNKKIDPPTPTSSARRKALDKLLGGMIDDDNGGNARTQQTTPLEHIFSHIRHTLWIETGTTTTTHAAASPTQLDDGRPVRWMTRTDMEQVGITSEVTKILKRADATSTKKATTKRSTKAKAPTTKRPAAKRASPRRTSKKAKS